MDQVEEDKFELTLTGEGISVARSIDAKTANAIISIVMTGGASMLPPAVETITPQAPSPTTREKRDRVSLREFLDEAGASRYPDKIVAIGQYMANHEDADTFTRDDIKSRFRAAGEAAPGNFPRDFAATLKSGWIAEDSHASGSYYVTKKGMEVISGGFSAEIRKNTKSRRRKTGAEQ